MSSTQALAVLKQRAESDIPASSIDGLMGGMPVFKGTRVSISYLFDLLKEGKTVDEFLSQYAPVEREDALRALKMASELMEVATYENTT